MVNSTRPEDPVLPFRITEAGPKMPHLVSELPGARIGPNGRILFNVPATRLVLAGARQLSNPNGIGIVWGADPLANEVAGRLVVGQRAHLTPIRYDALANTLSADLSPVLRNFPRLRPLRQQWVRLSPSTEERTDCFVVKLGVLLGAGTTHI